MLDAQLTNLDRHNRQGNDDLRQRLGVMYLSGIENPKLASGQFRQADLARRNDSHFEKRILMTVLSGARK